MKKSLIKKLLSVTLALMLVAVIFIPGASASALLLDDDTESFSIAAHSNELLFSVYNGEATLISCAPSVAGDIVLPDNVSGYPITTIGEQAFFACYDITSITIPKTVSVIEPDAFVGCYNIHSIYVDDENPVLKDIDGIVYSIDGTTLIRCPEGKTGTIAIADSTQDIYNKAFSSCDAVRKIIVPASVVYIADDIIHNGSTRPSFIVDENNRNFSSIDGALYDKNQHTLLYFPSAMTGSYTIPDTVTKINDYAFTLCTLSEIIIPESVTDIGEGAFLGCYKMTDITLPSSTRVITKDMFSFCIALEHFEIPDSVVEIEDIAFTYCDSLKTLTVPSSVIYFGNDIFFYTNNVMIVTDENTAAYNFALANDIKIGKELDGTIKSIAHTVAGGDIIFTVTTAAGDYNRVKVADAANASVSLGTGSSYTVNADGDYVWTFRITAPLTTTQFAFDLRSSTTGKYIKEYAYYTVAPYNPVSFNKSFWGTVQNGWYIHEDGGFTMNVGSWITYDESDLIQLVQPPVTTNSNMCAITSMSNLPLDEFDKIDIEWLEENVILGEVTSITKTTIGQYDYLAYHASAAGMELFICRTNTKTYVFGFMGVSYDTTELLAAADKAFDSIVFAGEPEKDKIAIQEKEEIKSVTHETKDGYVYFTVTTTASDINRIKVADKSYPSTVLDTVSSYTVNADGDYVWQLKIDAPTEDTEYTFDMRSSISGKYVKNYFDYTVEADSPIFKSITHKIIKDKLVITVVTKAGNYNRLRCGTSFSVADTIATASSYTVNADGDYVWTITLDADMENTSVIFDLRSSETNKYIKQYYGYYILPTQPVNSPIKDIVVYEENGQVVFTVTTQAGDFNRLRCGLSESIKDNLATTDEYTVNENGDYVWTIKIDHRDEDTIFYFDLRDGSTNKYIKCFYTLGFYA